VDFYEVLYTRRSIRSYEDTPIPDDVLNRVLDAARVAPSGANYQPWTFIVVRDGKLRKKVAEACHRNLFIADAPVIIVACGHPFNVNYNRGGFMGNLSAVQDVTIAFTHLILAARAEGLGTCWIGAYDNEGIKKALNIPELAYVAALSPLGYPKDNTFRRTDRRKSLEEIVKIDKYASR